MKQSCYGCQYAIRLGSEYYCNYLDITGEPRQFICDVTGPRDVCTVRVDGENLTQEKSLEDARQPCHKYALKASDLEHIRRHNKEMAEERKGKSKSGVPLSFDGDRARKLYEEDKLCDREVSEIMGVNVYTLKAWRLRHGIYVVRKRRTKAEIEAELEAGS